MTVDNLEIRFMSHISLYRRCWLSLRRFKATMSDKKVLITYADVPESAIDLLESRFKTTLNDVYTKEAVMKAVAGVHGILWVPVPNVRVDKNILDAAGPQLEVIGAMSAGLDHIDVEELKRRGIKLSNTPVVLDAAVADMAVLLALAASRRIHEGRKHIENGTWTHAATWMLGQDIGGSTVGIVGLGGIGQAIVKRLKAFHVRKFLYCGHKEKDEGKQLGAEFVPFDQLLQQSDFVIAACPLTAETKEMFNETAFSKMKKTAVFVNIARGGVVDQPALVKALKGGTIFAAGLDVMTPEPLPPDHELLNLPNCVLIPHLGSATIQTRKDMADLAAKNVIMALGGAEMLTPVY